MEIKDEKLQMYRHSMAHILAKALQEIYGKNLKLTIGPAITTGFYYDIDFEKSIIPEDFSKIEDKMAEIIKRQENFVRKEVSKDEALKLFKDNIYKLEIINELPKDEIISLYYLGEDFIDLCRGPHVENTKYLSSFSYKIDKVAGAYWRGNEKNKMLQRIYVLGFYEKKDLKEHLNFIEEAKKRDNRKLGKELGLFFVSDYAPGMPFYEPKGLIVKNELIKLWREKQKPRGYIEIETPQIMNRKLWEVSGHWEHYEQGMYTLKIDNEDYAIKPMSCPGCMLFYNENIHSYKDLPLKIAELGKVHRFESSGELNGLFRVRCFTQDDAHIFIREDQLEDQINEIITLIDEIYTIFGLPYQFYLSTMPVNHIGEESTWRKAEAIFERCLKKSKINYQINEGDGAFYGPKIDYKVTDALKRSWQCGTIQIDMQLPKRFNVEYVDVDGVKKQPVMLHRALFGSLERFFGVLIEHYAGAFPTWLAPVQVAVLPIVDKCMAYAKEIRDMLDQAGVRVELDERNETINRKIKEASSQKIPYLLIIGEKEVENRTVAVRKRGVGDQGEVKINDFIKSIQEKIKNRVLE